ncbi:MAG: hypothetical protein ACRCYQ_12140 [Nocardioides sp.]
MHAEETGEVTPGMASVAAAVRGTADALTRRLPSTAAVDGGSAATGLRPTVVGP